MLNTGGNLLQFNGLQNTGGQAIQSLQSDTVNLDHEDAIYPLTLLSLLAFNSLTKYTAKEQLFYSTGFFWLVGFFNKPPKPNLSSAL